MGSPDCGYKYGLADKSITKVVGADETACNIKTGVTFGLDASVLATVDATSFKIPSIIKDTTIKAADASTFEENVYAQMGGFWGASMNFAGGADGKRVLVQGDSYSVTGASTIGAIAAAVALVAAF